MKIYQVSQLKLKIVELISSNFTFLKSCFKNKLFSLYFDEQKPSVSSFLWEAGVKQPTLKLFVFYQEIFDRIKTSITERQNLICRRFKNGWESVSSASTAAPVEAALFSEKNETLNLPQNEQWPLWPEHFMLHKKLECRNLRSNSLLFILSYCVFTVLNNWTLPTSASRWPNLKAAWSGVVSVGAGVQSFLL